LRRSLHDAAGVDPEPEYARYQGTEISTASLPGEIRDWAASVGRRPVWELQVPLKRLAVSPEGAVAVDLVLNAPAGGPRPPAPRPAPSGDRERADAAHHPEETAWNALSYTLTVRLAPDPSKPR
jgi:hypothetical protein